MADTLKNNTNNKMDEFLFKINVSNEAYKTKEEATAALSARAAKQIGLHKMAWKEQSVTITQFIKLITAGHTFCGLFNLPDENKKVWIQSGQWWNYTYPVYHTGANKGCMKINFKRDDYYRGAQAIFVDIDKTAYTSHTKYIDKLKFKPTVAYYTFSDQPRDRRFRLVYILDKVYDELDIRAMALYITNSIEQDTNEKMEDKCGIRPSQYFNGAYHRFAIYQNTKAIYSITDFDIDWDTAIATTIDSDIHENTDCFDSDGDNEDNNDEDNENNNKDNEDNNEPVKNNKNNALEAPKSSITDPLAMIDEQMVKDIIHMTYNQFMYNYGNDKQHYRVYFRTQYQWEENQKYRVLTPEDDYLKLTYHRHKIEDLNHRRTITYRRMCERLLMKPDVSINELIYNGYYDIHNVIETDPYQEKGKDIPFDDRTKIADFLVRKAKLAFSQKQYLRENFKNAIDYYSNHRPRIVLNDTIAALDWRQELAVARTTETDNQIAEVYDLNLSVKDNWVAMKQMGIKIGLNRIYQWTRRYGIDTKIKSQTTKRKGTEERELRNQQLMAKYNLNLTEKQNSILLSISPSMSHLIKTKLISKSIS